MSPPHHAAVSEEGGARGPGWAGAAVAATLWTLAALAALAPLVPSAVSDDPGPDAFSVVRALTDVERLAAQPRPIGSPGHQQTRRHLVERLTELGLEVDVQRSLVFLPASGDTAEGALVQNVVARRPGIGSGGALVLVAHYDTVPGSPGAADNAAAVAALLEAARALGAGPPGQRDVVFVFTDGEEIGLLGARALVRHPWTRDVDAVLNFDARGTWGPSIMFETGPDSAPLVRLLASSATRPVATSYADDVYRRLSNRTDFSVFREAGWRGLNFAFIGGENDYHTRHDTTRRLDPRSLGHHGSQALALVRDLDGAALSRPAGGDGIYFNLPGWGLVVYPQAAALPIAAALALVLVALLIVQRRRGLRMRAAATAATGALGVLLAALAGGLVAHLLLRSTLDLSRSDGEAALVAAVVAFAAAAAVPLIVRLGRRQPPAELFAGTGVLAAVAALVTAVALPSASFLFAWPLAALLAAFAWAARRGPGRFGVAGSAGIALAALPTILLWVPAIVLLAIALGAEGAGAVAVATAVALGLLSPHLALLAGPRPLPFLRRAAVPAVLAAIAVALVVVAAAGGAGARGDSLFYVLDTERREAHWASFDERPDAWSEQYLTAEGGRHLFTDVFEGPPRDLLAAEAPLLALPSPAVAQVGETVHEDGGRRLRLAVHSPRGAAVMRIALRAASGIGEVQVEDEVVFSPSGDAGEARSLVLHGIAGARLDVEVELLAPGPLLVTLMDVAYGLPTVPGRSFRPRGPGLIPSPSAPTDVSLVRSALAF